MKLQAFFTASSTPASWAIRRVSGGQFSHTGLVFTMTADEWETAREGLNNAACELIRPHENGHYRVYFESWFRKWEFTGKNGVRGPIPFSHLAKWGSEPGNVLDLIDVPVLPESVPLMLAECGQAVKFMRYAMLQLGRNYLGFRLGRGVPLSARSRFKWTCSETDVRIIARGDPRFAVTRLRLGEQIFDEYAPSGRRGLGLYELLAHHR